MEIEIIRLKQILDKSNYTVALCGSGIMAEGGFIGIKKSERAYEIEEKYGSSPEEIFSSAYFNTRPAKFFQFYEQEMLSRIPNPGPTSACLAAMERAGRLQCIISANIFEQERRGGCENVIDLHGSVFKNRCSHCGEYYSLEDVRQGGAIPHCRICHSVIRPLVSLYGEMVDSRIMTRTTEEIEKAEVLLLLGTSLQSEVFSSYLRYYQGKNLIIIHKEPHFTDRNADLVFVGEPSEVLKKLGY